MNKGKMYEEGSIMHYAAIGFENIKNLSESSLISEKLLGLNSIMFVLVMTINISSWFRGSSEMLSIEYLIFFLLSLLISFIISIVYSPILSVVSNFSTNKVKSLQVGLTVLFVSLPLAVAGIALGQVILTKVSFITIGFQIVLILFSSAFPLLGGEIPDITVAPSQIWMVIDKVSAICGILSFLVSILLIILG